jgi:hypothetical protein
VSFGLVFVIALIFYVSELGVAGERFRSAYSRGL